MSVAQRKFFSEVSALADRTVTVATTAGKTFTGLLLGVNPDSMSLILSEAKDEEGKLLHRVAINGKVVASVFSVEKPFDLKALSDRLEKVFPTMVKLYEDKGFIWVMDKVKVTERGVVEGSGPAAERVEKVYATFMNEAKGKT
jgi:small nuclear ribonucleoprotein (snRNP)-like protein